MSDVSDKMREKATKLLAEPHLIYPAASCREAVLLFRLADAHEALLRFGIHRPPCALWITSGDAGPNGELHECTCGYSAALTLCGGAE